MTYLVHVRYLREGSYNFRGATLTTGVWHKYCRCFTRSGANNSIVDAQDDLKREGLDEDFEFTITTDIQ